MTHKGKRQVMLYDSGEKVPERLEFTNVDVDEEAGTFKGDLVFAQTISGGMKVVEYSFNLSQDCKMIESGSYALYRDEQKQQLAHKGPIRKQDRFRVRYEEGSL